MSGSDNYYKGIVSGHSFQSDALESTRITHTAPAASTVTEAEQSEINKNPGNVGILNLSDGVKLMHNVTTGNYCSPAIDRLLWNNTSVLVGGANGVVTGTIPGVIEVAHEKGGPWVPSYTFSLTAANPAIMQQFSGAIQFIRVRLTGTGTISPVVASLVSNRNVKETI